MRLKTIIPAMFLASTAFSQPVCKPYPFLKDGFDFTAYSQCKNKFVECPIAGGVPKFSCVKALSDKTAECSQLAQLSKVIDSNPAAVTAEKMQNYTLINQYFIADGQNHYYIISPQGCMLDTIVDPRELSPTIKKEYEHADFMIINADKPAVLDQAKDEISFHAVLKITKSCLACETIGYANINFIFDHEDKFVKATLENFSPEQTNNTEPQQN